ncbi:hypothetical protein EVJ58_g7535 [Rhodofomes roseus]|uniref:Uncharacterized protein n=1 Tax=Rhodofomes roseus TaxID=34475 RepID=A0A4Y9Y342_9APHY|nr:hypothetical protein EVJ58_g7535 [Rhodofomes roseus]
MDGLLPSPANEVVLTLLYRMAEWHALAKLRLHTDSSLARLDAVTVQLGHAMRRFVREVCSAYKTYELPKETEQRARRNAKHSLEAQVKSSATGTARKRRDFNLSTYKYHSFPDYPPTFSNQRPAAVFSLKGEREHKHTKAMFGRTNKKNIAVGIARQERRENYFRSAESTSQSVEPSAMTEEPIPSPDADMDIRMHHRMSHSTRNAKSLYAMARDLANDPAAVNFIPKLQDHLLARYLGYQFNGDEYAFTDTDRASVCILHDTIYEHPSLHVNYTTYDVRRDQDYLNSTTHRDVLLHSCETQMGSHPYWYARIIGIYHADVLRIGDGVTDHSIQSMEFLWVRWFGIDPEYRYGARVARLPKIGFVPLSDNLAFGFLDPSLIIRACHLMAAFADGRTTELLPVHTIARSPAEHDDWVSYYVGIFADRDMFMRYDGGGVGHVSGTNHGITSPEDEETDESEDGGEEPASGSVSNGSDDGEDESDDVDEDFDWDTDAEDSDADNDDVM